jgi:hypothetical protein
VHDTLHSAMQSSRADRGSQDWFPDWLPDSAHRTSIGTNTASEYLQPGHPASGFDNYRLSDVSNGPSSTSGKVETIEEHEAEDGIPSALPRDEVSLERDRDRAVKYASVIDTSSAILTVP